MKFILNITLAIVFVTTIANQAFSQSKISLAVEDHNNQTDTFYLQKKGYNSLNLSFSDDVSSFFIGRNSGENSYGNWNIGIGNFTLQNLLGGASNIAIGNESLLNLKNGLDNIAIGDKSLLNNVDATANVAIGSGALENHNLSNTVAIGYNALRNNGVGATTLSEGLDNTAIGYLSLLTNTKGYNNTAVGSISLINNINGFSNTAIGDRTLNSNSSGNFNTAVGSSSMIENTLGNSNTSLGYRSLALNTIGSRNVAIGLIALGENIDGERNIAIGNLALSSITSGSSNTAMGDIALSTNTDGSNNTAIGQSAGHLNKGNNNVFIGANAGANDETGSNKLYIANTNTSIPLIYGEFDTKRMVINGKDNDGSTAAFQISDGARTLLMDGNEIDGSGTTYINDNSNQDIVLGGNVGIGISTPSKHLTIADATSPAVRFERIGNAYDFEILMDNSADLIFRGGNTGTLTSTHDIFTFENDGDFRACGSLNATSATVNVIACSSDVRFKKNIVPLHNALSSILKLQGVNYDWRTDEFTEKNFTSDRQVGFIAQEIEKIYPSMVLTDDEGFKSVDYSRLTPVLVEAIKEQQAEIELLKDKLEKTKDLEVRLAKIEALLGN